MRVKATLTLTVVYDGYDGRWNESDAVKRLKALAAHAADEGLMSGDDEAVVDCWTAEVSTVRVST